MSTSQLVRFANDPASAEDTQQTVERLESLYTQAKRVRRDYEQEWYNNILLISGRPWVEFQRDVLSRDRLVTFNAPHTTIKAMAAGAYTLTRSAASILRDNLASMIATPATSDQSDVDAAEIATDLLDYRQAADRENELRYNEILWTLMCGRVYRSTIWDPRADGHGVTGKVANMGDMKARTLDPWKVLLPPYSDCMSDPEWLIVADVWSVEEVNETFKGKDVKGEEVADAMRFLDKLRADAVENNGMAGSGKRNDAVIVKILYHAPKPGYPNGHFFIWANKVLLDQGELPDDVVPVTSIDWFPIPSRLYPLPFVTPLRGLQIEINKILSQLIELKNRQLRGDKLIKGATALPGELTEEDDYNPDDWNAPWFTHIDPDTRAKTIYLGPTVQEYEMLSYDTNITEAELLIGRMWNEMMQAAGIHEQALGQAAPHQTTATAALSLKESDLSGLTVFRTGMNLQYGKVAEHKLLLAKNHYKSLRIIRNVGQSNAVRVSAFLGSDLRDTSDVRPDTLPLRTESMVIQMRQDAHAAGLYGPYLDGVVDLANKIEALLHTGIPNIRSEVDDMLSPMTLSELREARGRVLTNRVKAGIIASEGELDGAVLQKMMQDQQGQQLIDGPQEEVAPLGLAGALQGAMVPPQGQGVAA